ncbi:MAG: hypothetical protein FWE45_03220 [Firmicutes bacterium]|nr:hypothetical protein [Bacillota bacterium]
MSQLHTHTTRKYVDTIVFVSIALALGILCFAIPLINSTYISSDSFFGRNHQFFVGPAVNAALVLAAIKVRGWVKVISLVMLPSISSIALGLWFAVGGLPMLYMVPAIWLGNTALVLAFKFIYNQGIKKQEPAPLYKNEPTSKKLKHTELRYSIAAIIGIGAKVGIIFGVFIILRSFGVFPTPAATAMWTVMGINQLITATAGCIIAYGVVKTTHFIKSKKQVQV